MAKVLAVCISEKKGTMKHPVDEVELKVDHGIVGDAHAGNWHRQVSLLADESVEKMRAKFPDIPVGAFAENILTEGLVLYELPIGTRLQVGETLLEVTQIGKECHADCAIRQQVGDCVMPREGIFAVVLKGGTVKAGDEIHIIKKEIKESTFECQRDGLTIRGTEFRPEGENLPIAIVSHGFMGTQVMERERTMYLAEMGYAAYCYDFCGGSFMSTSDGKTEEMSVLTEVKDLEAVIDHIRSLPYVNKDHIVLLGCSQGGFVSALVAAKNKYPIDRLALFFPALCIPDDVREGKMPMTDYDPANIPETFQCGPMLLGRIYVTDLIDMDPFEEIKTYNGRVFIAHGTNDVVVPASYAERAAEAYRATTPEGMTEDERITLRIIEGGTHGFMDNKEDDRYALDQMRQFLQN